MEEIEDTANVEAWSWPETKVLAKFFTTDERVDGGIVSEEALLERNIQEMETYITMEILSHDQVYFSHLSREVEADQHHRGCRDWRAPGGMLPPPRSWPQTGQSVVTTSIITRTQMFSSSSSISQFRSAADVGAEAPLPSNSLFRRFDIQALETQEAARRMGARFRRHSGCGFCKKNGEPTSIYTSHRLHGEQGRVTCPYLRELVCEVCGATGDSAHTRTYCPNLRSEGQVALPTLLKATKHQSDGKLRKRGGR